MVRSGWRANQLSAALAWLGGCLARLAGAGRWTAQACACACGRSGECAAGTADVVLVDDRGGVAVGDVVLGAQPVHALVEADVSIGPVQGGAYGLAVKLRVTIPGADPEQVRSLTEAAHQVCPYSNATRGNIDVTLEAG